jgi:hypothetical protein
MSTKEKFRRILLFGAIGLALLTGTPMRPEEIEDLMHQMNQPKVAHTLPDECDQGDDPNRRSLLDIRASLAAGEDPSYDEDSG